MERDACIFCEIIAGRAPASVVYVAPQVVAFLDIRPVNPGHILVVPRTHAAGLAELAPEDAFAMIGAGQRLAAALRRSGVRCEAVNLFLADGAAAGQTVFHVHLHVVPRFRGDGFGFRFRPDYGERLDAEAQERIAAQIRSSLEG